MKKYIILSLISLSLILTVIATGYTKVKSIEYASAVRIEGETAVEQLNYSGTVEYKNSSVCVSSGTGMVQSVLVNNGDYVKKGDYIVIAYQTESELSKTDILSAITSGDYDKLNSMFENNSSVVVYEAGSSGIISDLSLEESSVIHKGQTLFKISPENSFQVQINVTENDIPKIQVGQSVRIDCKAASDVFRGTVSSISKSAKQTTTASGKETTVKVTVQIDDANSELRSGYTAACCITVAKAENVLLAPYNGVAKDECGDNFVYLLCDSAVKKHYVICGKEYNNGIEIKDGLLSGDIILSDISEVENPENAVVDEVRVNEQ